MTRRYSRLKKLMVTLLAALGVVTLWATPAFAGDNYITSYAFADIAGNISGDTITVTVPYSTKTTYWDHRVDVSDGANYRAGAITSIDEMHSEGQITVTSDEGKERVYTVKINKAKFKEPTYELGKAKSIKSDKAKIEVNIDYNDAVVSNCTLYYYTSKNSKSQKNIPGEGENEIELTGLKPDTKYYYYVSIKVHDRVYESSAKSFKTKDKNDQGTNTSSGSSSNKTSSSGKNNTNKGTNAKGPGTDAKNNPQYKNQWVLEDGKWYYYGADGYSKTGWFQVGDKWYYVIKGANELVMGKWMEINDEWYYFDASGAMVANNWVLLNNNWYWMQGSGSMARNQEINIGGRRYMLDPSGVVVSDQMIYKDNRWLYCKPGAQGIAVNEQCTVEGVTFNTDANGYVY